MKMNFPSTAQSNRQQVVLAGAAGVIVLAALGWFFFLRPAEGEPAADTVNVAARARAARAAAIARRKAAGDSAPVAQAGAKVPVTAKDSAAMTAAGPASARKADSAATSKGAAKPAPATPAAKPATATAAAPAPADSGIVITREEFAFDPAGRRDPFISLMSSDDLRPAVSDLRVSGILWHPTRPVAVLRDDANREQYRVTVGSVLGRMRVTQIKPKTVIFTIEEFGYNRRDSLILGDTAQVRAR